MLIKNMEKLKNEMILEGKAAKKGSKQHNHVEDLEQAINELKKHRWIPVTESLPDHMDIVIVSYKAYICGTIINGVTMGLRIDDSWEVLEPRSWGERQNIEIVAWKPRPEAYLDD